MTKPQDYTVKQFIQEIKTIIEANPDKVNAFNKTISGHPGGCVYENQQGDHCIIGEFLSSIDLLDSLPWSKSDKKIMERRNASHLTLALTNDTLRA